MNPVLTTLAAHRSVRAFQPTPIAPEVVLEAVQAAQQAATSSNVQAYCLLQVEDRTEREELAELTGGQPQVAEAGAFFVVCAEQRRFRLMAEDRGEPFCPNLESFLVGVVDASLFAQNLVLAFEAQGLGTCYIGGLRTRSAEVDALLELPADVFPLYGLCVGVPAEDPERKPRLAPTSVLYRGRCPSEEELRAQVAEYDGRMQDYYDARGLSGRDWSGGVHRKFRAPQREHLHDYYEAKGARLR